MSTNHFNQAFGDDGGGYVYIGDTITADVDGINVTAHIVFDDQSSPLDYMDAVEDASAIAAWHNDEWCYVGVVLSVAKGGITLDKHAASLWGIGCNFPHHETGLDNSYLTDVANELLPDAIAIAQRTLCRLCAA